MKHLPDLIRGCAWALESCDTRFSNPQQLEDCPFIITVRFYYVVPVIREVTGEVRVSRPPGGHRPRQITIILTNGLLIRFASSQEEQLLEVLPLSY